MSGPVSLQRFIARLRRRHLALAVALAVGSIVASPRFNDIAAAAVAHDQGFQATVAGFTSWFGSYRLADIGTVWCVDHGIPAPDADLGYQPASLAGHSDDTTRAMAWALGRAGPTADPVTAAALMLVMHDLMGARYPTGALDVDALAPSGLAGFAGHEAEVVQRAQAIKADAVAHSHLQGPFTMTLTSTVPADAPAPVAGVLTARVVDADGTGVAGVAIRLAGGPAADTAGATDATGSWHTSISATEGDTHFNATAVAPVLALRSLAPTRGVAQRVALPVTAQLSATAVVTVRPHHRLTVHKEGDDEPYLPVAGARFAVAGHTIASDQPLDLEPGRYQVTETTAPSGYATAGPWDVDLTGGDAVLEVLDHALQGSVKVTKTDAVTHAPLAGARLLVRYDADRDGRFDTDVATFTSDARPRILDHLRPGDYQLSEAAPPPGYRPAARPAMFTVAPGRQAEVTLADAPRTSVTFAKSPPLAGAVFAVSDDRGHELGRCTSASDGRCHLGDDIFQPGQRLCWKEVVAPPGYATAAGECMTAAAGAMVVAVTDVALPVPVAVPERPVPPAQAVVKAQQIPAPVAAELPRTGGTPGPLVAIGDALLLAGWVFLAVGRLRRRRP